MIIVQDEKLNQIDPMIRHGFFGRQGGVSAGIFNSLNCRFSSCEGEDNERDSREHVVENRKRLVFALADEGLPLVTVNQIHSSDCVVVDRPFETGEIPDADALVTDKAGLVIGVSTADCGPVLFAGKKEDGAPVIGAAHAGWKGALNGVTDAVIDKMLALGVTPDSIQATVGPCIARASYEVSENFAAPFVAKDPMNEHFFEFARKDGHLMFDLAGYIASRLAQKGVRHVTITGRDTYALENDFFSYRRKTHRKEPNYGGQISAIMMKRD